MEYWVLKADDDLILIPDQRNLCILDFIPLNPVFQHSIIPLPHGIRLRHSRLFLTWLKGPGYSC